jgi:hypothetical protein
MTIDPIQAFIAWRTCSSFDWTQVWRYCHIAPRHLLPDEQLWQKFRHNSQENGRIDWPWSEFSRICSSSWTSQGVATDAREGVQVNDTQRTADLSFRFSWTFCWSINSWSDTKMPDRNMSITDPIICAPVSISQISRGHRPKQNCMQCSSKWLLVSPREAMVAWWD